jgi:hypothetical protein
LNELDSLLHNLPPKQQFHWSQCLQSSQLENSAIARLESYTEFWKGLEKPDDRYLQCSLDSFAVSMGLGVFIQERILSQGLDVNGKHGKPLLRYATEINQTGYVKGTWKGPNVKLVALLVKHGASVNTSWRGASIFRLAFHDLCEFFNFRRRLLGVEHFFLHIPHLDALLELLKAESIRDINLIDNWPSSTAIAKKGTPLDVLYDCLHRVSEFSSSRSELCKRSRARFNLLIEGMKQRSAMQLADLEILEAETTKSEEGLRKRDDSVASKTKDVVMDEKGDHPTRNFSAEEATKNARLKRRRKKKKTTASKITPEPREPRGLSTILRNIFNTP